MTVGATDPASAPMELTMAIPPAAAVPRRKRVDSAQNGPSDPQIPIAARHSAGRTISVVWHCPTAPTPTAATMALAATCQRRSLWRSAWCPIATMLHAATTYGIADSSPT